MRVYFIFLKSFYHYLIQDRTRLLMTICGLLFFITGFIYVACSILPTGDEPHYLIISQTLLKYHSLDAMLDYKHGDYFSFYPVPIIPHLAHNTRGQLLPYHGIGGPLLWLIPFFFFGRLGAVWFISLVSVLIVFNIYKFLLMMGIRERYAFLISLAYGIASPVYLYAHLTFVEPIGALVGIYVLRIIFQEELSVSDVVVSSTLLGILPWVHIRFALLEIPLFFFLLYTIYQQNRLKNLQHYLYFLIPITVFFLLFELYSYQIWGTLNPAVNEMNNNTAPFEKSPFSGIIGMFFDQQFGIFMNYPMFIFLFMGAILTVKKKFLEYNLLIIIVSIPYIIAFTTLRHWSGGWSPPARFFTVMLPMYAFYLGYALEQINNRTSVILFKATIWFGFIYNILSILPTQFGFNGEAAQNHTITFIQLFGHHLTDYFPSSFVPGQTGLFIVWICLFVGISVMLICSKYLKIR